MTEETSQPEVREPRNLWGWIGLGLLFLLLIVATGDRRESKAAGQQLTLGEAESKLQRSVSAKLAQSGLPKGLLPSERDVSLPAIAEGLASKEAAVPRAAVVRAALLEEAGKPIPESTLEAMSLSRLPEVRAAGVLYATKKPSRGLIEANEAKLAPLGKLGKVVVAHASVRGGLADPYKGLKTVPGLKPVIAILGILAILAVGATGWMAFLLFRASGEFPPLGLPLEPISPGKADLMALRGLQVFLGFLVISNLISAARIPSAWAQYVTFGLVVLGLVVLFQTSLGEAKISLADIGLNRTQWLRNVGMGVVGACMELPLAVALMLALRLLVPGLQAGGHPAEQLMVTQDPIAIIGWFIGGAVLAPLWEEIFFRGLLFPALKGVLRSVLFAAVLSSVLFAVIHPQGAAFWVALATTGMFSCLLAHQTRSLVPSVVMHFTHNFFLLSLMLLIR